LAKVPKDVAKEEREPTLSPLPRLPTRFMPSFQSPEPISGKPVAHRTVKAVQNRLYAMRIDACAFL
jgi:hypothetical protein